MALRPRHPNITSNTASTVIHCGHKASKSIKIGDQECLSHASESESGKDASFAIVDIGIGARLDLCGCYAGLDSLV